MKNLTLPTKAVILILFLSIIVFGQFPDNQFVNGKGGFTIDLPKEPIKAEEKSFELFDFELVGNLINWQGDSGFFASIENYVVYGEEAIISEKDKLRILNEYKKQNADEMKKAGIIISEHPYSFSKSKGFEIRGTLERRTILRGFFIQNRLIILGVVKSNVNSFESLNKILESFRLLTKKEHIEVLIIENTPKLLPQITSKKPLLNDLKEKNLKGEIKAIFEEFVRLPQDKRELWGDEFFNKNGNLLKDISYTDDYPETISVYGWVDDMRVSRNKYINYAQGEGPDMSGTLVATLAPTKADSAPKKIDNRFDVRHETKLDSKNLIIEQNKYSNDGTLFSSEKSSYVQEGRIILNYGGKDQWFGNRTQELFNDNGDVIESRVSGEDGKDPDIEIYEYEYDSKKNWIVKKTFEKTVKKGKIILKPTYVNYRNIVYYE